MRVIGLGFRKGATLADLEAAISGLPDAATAEALATADDKAGAPALLALASKLGLPVVPVDAATLGRQPVLTRSVKVAEKRGTGSVAEAAALAAAGPGAELSGPRVVGASHMATAALACSGKDQT